ncbi:hypothetical protein C8R46DRAFT_1134488 [Mycena filopes]|nr:hypothetical protein C8R46DRAFT_1134488 [Mycena filopes]
MLYLCRRHGLLLEATWLSMRLLPSCLELAECTAARRSPVRRLLPTSPGASSSVSPIVVDQRKKMAKLTSTLGANVPPEFVLSTAPHRRGCRACPRSTSRPEAREQRHEQHAHPLRTGPPAASRKQRTRGSTLLCVASCCAANGPALPPTNTPTSSRSTGNSARLPFTPRRRTVCRTHSRAPARRRSPRSTGTPVSWHYRVDTTEGCQRGAVLLPTCGKAATVSDALFGCAVVFSPRVSVPSSSLPSFFSVLALEENPVSLSLLCAALVCALCSSCMPRLTISLILMHRIHKLFSSELP